MGYLLVADDDEDFSDALSIVLRNAGHEVAVANDVRTALASAERRPPDLGILDVMFPEDKAAGFRLALALRSSASGLPIIMLSAVNESTPLGFVPRQLAEPGEAAVDLGGLSGAEFLEKPVDFKLLLERVDALLVARARARRVS